MFAFDVDLSCPDDLAVLAAYIAEEDNVKASQTGHESSAKLDEVVEQTETSPSSEEDADDAVGARPQRYIWVRRLRAVAGIPHERMAPIHGRLIAHGLLQFQLQGQNEGVVYRVTTAGRRQSASTGGSTPATSDSTATLNNEAA